MKMLFVLALFGLGCAGFTACSTGRVVNAPAVSDLDSAQSELAKGAVDVCLGNTVYITNRHAGFLAPKLQAGQPVVCGVAPQVASVVVAPKATHKKR
jgi:hypothetical protein